MPGYAPSQRGNYGSFFTGSGRRVRQHAGQQGQGSMNAFYSGASQLVRHSVPQSQLFPELGVQVGSISDQKACAFPLVVYGNTSGNQAGTEDESASAYISSGSRVNNVQLDLSITQADSSKPNNCYIGFIATSFSEGALHNDLMETQFGDLVRMTTPESSGIMSLSRGQKDMTMETYNESPFLKHNVRGFNKYAYTLYSGRPALLKTVLPTPPKCRRGQFGMGWWLVLLNDSSAIQGETAGNATSFNFSFNSYFKEIQDIRAEVR